MEGSGLLKLARQIQNCVPTMVKMGWAEELNNPETLLKVIDRLPQCLQMQFAERAESFLKLVCAGKG